MHRYYFKCTFLSDVVLHASSNTEGKIERLDYIPGSNFLGMVACDYEDFGANAKQIFHDGAVRFGDASLLIEDEMGYAVPFSWFAPKKYALKEAIEKDKVYNDHFLTTAAYDDHIAKGIQLKQQRNGYITASYKSAALHHTYTQKSAYDKSKRRSKKSQMFGYHALPKGTAWLFSVEVDDGISKERRNQIIDLLTSARSLGKSRSAEYGQIRIEQIDSPAAMVAQGQHTIPIEGKHYIFLYAASRLALTDAYGINSYRPTAQTLGIENECAAIDWERSQVRVGRYTPYVGARANFDPERLVIERGSVIAVAVPEGFDVSRYTAKVERGVGICLSEGLGRVLVNPAFVTKEKPSQDRQDAVQPHENNSTVTPKRSEGRSLTEWLTQQQNKEQQQYALLSRVKKFIDSHPDVRGKKSQWGQIRALCNSVKDDEDIIDKLFGRETVNNHPKGFLLHGKAKEKWSVKLIKAIKDEKSKEDYLNFIKLLSIYAPKEDDREETKENTPESLSTQEEAPHV